MRKKVRLVLMGGTKGESLRRLTRRFLDHAQKGEFETIWDELITVQAQNLISTASFPVGLLNDGKTEQFLDIEHIRGLALGFQMDLGQMRTGYFAGVVSSFEKLGWYDYSPENPQASMVFTEGNAAVLVGDSAATPILMFFIGNESGDFVIDWQALAVFSMTLSSQKLFEIGTIALVNGKQEVSELFFDLSRDLLPTYESLKVLAWTHPLVGKYITSARKAELESELLHARRAQFEADATRSGGRVQPEPLNLHSFLSENFRQYAEVDQFQLDSSELRTLQDMSDDDLRTKVASLLVNADPAIAMREAAKPHGPAELADIVVDVPFLGQMYSLCLPFKSGREYRSRSTVPSSMAYQIWRPHMFLSRAIVVLITAKPCSQNLLGDIRQSRDRLGWPIEVIQAAELGSMLKANGLL